MDAISRGDPEAKKELFAHLYNELHSLAHKARRREYEENLLQTTGLVHETYLSFMQNEGAKWLNKAHFFSAAARIMRFILIDEARKRKAVKRSASLEVLSLDKVPPDQLGAPIIEGSLRHLDELDRALEKLAKQFKRQCTIVELRFFAGLTIAKTAEVMELSEATVKRDWETAREWLRREMKISPSKQPLF